MKYHLEDRPLVWLLYLCLISLVATFYFASLRAIPLDHDESIALRENTAISKDFKVILTGHHNPSGRPMGHLVRWVAYLLWGNDTAFFHLFSVVIHVFVSFSLALLVRKMDFGMEGSLLCGLLFLVNVAHFTAVYHLASLEYLLSGFFVILAVLVFLRFLSSGLKIWLWSFFFFASCGVLAHVASAVIFPFVLYWIYAKATDPKACLRYLVPMVLLLVMLGTFVLWIPVGAPQTTTARSIAHFLEGDLGSIVGSAGTMLVWFLARLFNSAHGIPVALWQIHTWELYCGTILLAFFVFIIYRKKDSLPAYSAVWTLLFLLPFTFLPEHIVTFNQGPSHYLYLASAGSSMLLAWLICHLSRLKRVGVPVSFMVVLVLLTSSYVNVKQMEAFAFYASGRYYIASGQIETGIVQFERALARGRNVIPLRDTYYRLCNLRLASGANLEPTLTQARTAFPGDSAFDAIYYALESVSPDLPIRRWASNIVQQTVQSSMTQGRDEHIAFRSMMSTIYHNLGLGLSRQQNFKVAILAYQKSLEFDSTRTKTRALLSKALRKVEQRIEKGHSLAENP